VAANDFFSDNLKKGFKMIRCAQRRTISKISASFLILFVASHAAVIADMWETPFSADFFPLAATYFLISSASGSVDETERGVEIKKKEEGPPESLQQPGTTRPALPEFTAPRGMPGIVLPPVLPSPEKEGTLWAGLRVHVRQINFAGNTAIKGDELREVSAAYENRTLTSEELGELCHKLTSLYVEKGYINSGAVIPDQKVVDGVITIQIIEGKLSNIEIAGNKWLRSSYIRNRIALAASVPFNINQLQEELLILQEDPLLRRISAQLLPGIKPGDAILKVMVDEETPYQIGLQISNNRSPSIGALHGEIFAVHRNISGWGDSMGVRYGRNTDGLEDGGDEVSLSYNLPLNAFDTTLRAYYDYSNSRVIEEPFDQIDIKSKLETVGVSISQPILKTLSNEVRLTLAAEKRRSESFLLGQPFSFSEGVENGVSNVTALRFAQEWLYRSPHQVLALRSNISWGIDALGATINDTGMDGRFLAWLLQVQWARLFERMNKTQIIFRTDLQLSRDPLLAMEKFSVGGATSVRGYRENQIVRDKAVVSSLECRIPILRLPISDLSNKQADGTVQLAPFFDWGWAENVDRPTPEPRTIASVGLGLRWDPTANIHMNIYWGYALRKIDNPHKDLQDYGFHFQLNVRFF
jgi:hemolysin activation/secretion protein